MKWHYSASNDVSIGHYRNIKIEWRSNEWEENSIYVAQLKSDLGINIECTATTLQGIKDAIDEILDGKQKTIEYPPDILWG